MTGVRVAVDYRILSVGKGLIRRGLGRFTQQQLRAVLAVDTTNEYLLVCHPGADLLLVDPAIRRARNVSVLYVPAAIVPNVAESMPTRLRRAEQFQQWLVDERIDLFHATTAFYPAEPMLSSFDACPMVATFYDAIPLLFPAHYFLGPVDKAIYGYAVSLLRSATRLIAISGASGQDAVDRLGIPRDRIDIAYPSVDRVFTPMSARDVDHILAGLSRRVRIPSQFVFTVSYPHHSKNLENLLRAFSLLPDDVRLRLPLVACCTVDEASSVVWYMARQLGIADDLVVTGPLSDEELAALYNRATLVVHPSRYEGFGLPVAEAMKCGTPVITTTSSSLPEIAGGAALLVDPDEVEAMSKAMLGLYRDGARRDAMVGPGLAQSARFDEPHLAAATIDSYAKAVAPRPSQWQRPRIAVWSPMPPADAPAAPAAAELLDELGRTCDIEVFVGDGAEPALSSLGRRPVHHFGAFGRRQSQSGFDAVLYHVDDSPAHVFVRESMRDHPGIAIVHRATWGRALLEVFRSQNRVDDFRTELEALEGPQAVRALRALAAEDAAAESDFWRRYPMLGHVIEGSLGQIVHDPSVAEDLGWRYPSSRFFEVPLGAADPASPVRRKAVRADLGCDDATLVVVLFADGATLAATEACVRAVAMATHGAAEPVMVLAPGACEPGARDLAARLGLDMVSHAGAEAAGDVAVCVRTGSPAVLAVSLRAMAWAMPVLWADARAAALDTSPLAEQLRELRADRDLLARRGAEARATYEQRHTLARSASAYLDVIAAVTGKTIERGQGSELQPRPDVWDDILQVLTG